MAQTRECGELVVRSEVWLSDLPNSDFVQFMFTHFRRWPSSNTAIMCERTGRSYTYGELEEGSLKWGAALLDLSGGSAPPCVAILAPNIPEYPMAVLGAMAVGSVVTNIPTSMTAIEIAKQLLDTGVTAMLIDSTMEEKFQVVLDLMTEDQRPLVMFVGATTRRYLNLLDIINDETAKKVQPFENAGSKTAIIPFSSGTTGPFKGVCLPHSALSNSIVVLTHPNFCLLREVTKDHQASSIGVMPFCHMFGLLAVVFPSLYLGAKVVCLPDHSPLEYAEAILAHKVQTLHVAPYHLIDLTNSPLVTREHLSSVRVVKVATAAVHPTIAMAFKGKADKNCIVQEGFGVTESLGLIMTPLEEERLGCCGKLLPNTEAKVVDTNTGTALGPNLPGELLVKGPSLFSHYHLNPEATADALRWGGWLHTGDIVQYDEDGFFSIIGRDKEIIKVDGDQVPPSELEEVILQVEAVAEAGVVGVPSALHGQLPKAFVVLKNMCLLLDQKHLDLVKKEINERVAEKLSPHMKLAGGIAFVGELPRNATGKLLRKKLLEKAMTMS